MIFSNWFTEDDNATFCPFRATTLGAIGMYHIGAVYGVISGALHADMVTLGQYANHMMTLGGTLAAGVSVRSAASALAK